MRPLVASLMFLTLTALTEPACGIDRSALQVARIEQDAEPSQTPARRSANERQTHAREYLQDRPADTRHPGVPGHFTTDDSLDGWKGRAIPEADPYAPAESNADRQRARARAYSSGSPRRSPGARRPR